MSAVGGLSLNYSYRMCNYGY